MKPINLHSILTTDVRVLLHRICFALCPPRVEWSIDERLGDPQHCSPASVENISGSWNSGILWGNSVFWSSGPTWGHSSGHENGPADAYSRSEYTE
jgi:hypothetical protein